MPVYYSPQDPARYYQYQQSRNDQKMTNMLQMMMQMRALKQRKNQFAQQQVQKQQQFALDVAGFKSIDQYRKTLAKQAEEQTKRLGKQVTTTRDRFNLAREVGVPSRQAMEMALNWKPVSSASQELTAYQKLLESERDQAKIRTIIKGVKADYDRFVSDYARSSIGLDVNDPIYKNALKAQGKLSKILSHKILNDSDITESSGYADLLSIVKQNIDQNTTTKPGGRTELLDTKLNPIK